MTTENATAAVLPHEVAERVLSQLSEVWDSIGVATSEREQHIAKLSEAVTELFNNKLAEEQAKRDALLAEIDAASSRIASLQQSTGCDTVCSTGERWRGWVVRELTGTQWCCDGDGGRHRR